MGKENKPSNDIKQVNKVNQLVNIVLQPVKNTKTKNPAKGMPKEFKTSDSPVNSEDKVVEDFKVFMDTLFTSKREIQIKPNIPAKWINDLKAKLAKVQSQG